MKKILFTCDGMDFSGSAFAFIKWLCLSEPVKVTGVFFSSVSYQMLLETSIGAYTDAYEDYKVNSENEIDHSIDRFEQECRKNDICYRVHRESEFWNTDEIGMETRFADLFVLGSEQFSSGMNNEQPNSYLRQTIHSSECPVLVIPRDFEPPEEIMIAYNGKKDCLHAMKQFCYMFPTLTNMPANIFYIKDEQTENIPLMNFLEEYAACHFSDLNIGKMHFDEKKIFPAWASKEKNKLIVTGSFGRSVISDVFNRSFAEKIIGNNNLPVFIAHQA